MEGFRPILPLTAGQDQAGCLSIAGHSLRELADQYGTPLYIYDAATLRDQVRRLREALAQAYPGSSEITYAAKAYFSPGVARRLIELDLSVDVVSLGELTVARQAGFLPSRVHMHGNNKSPEELLAGLAWDIQAIVVDSLDELDLLEGIVAARKQPARIWLRISPGVSVATHAFLQTSHAASKFGLPVEDGQALMAIQQARSSHWLKLVGLHTHLGSQFFETGPYCQAVHSLIALAGAAGFVPEEFSPGGGWGVPYLPGRGVDDPAPWIRAVSGALQEEFSGRGWPLPRLVVEPGRWLIARAGIAVYRVGSGKTAGDGTRMVAVDGGMADNPRPALYDAEYTAILVDRPDSSATQRVRLVGKYCENGDCLIRDVWLPEVHRDDLLAIPVAGAYQLSMASNYNLAPRPAVLWLESGRVDVLQSREQLAEAGWWADKDL